MSRSLDEWLEWQESLNPAEIDLGLERVRVVAARLDLRPPPGNVFVIAGTNGKGSSVAAMHTLLSANELRTGVYTSPHLLTYNERICIAGNPVDDVTLVSAFDQVEAAREGLALTYFEYGTLAAMSVFSAQRCTAWVLEVGLGGRLDAVNIADADAAIITTVDIDHQVWLGNTIEQIAAEKAGIMRAGRPAFYGDVNAPQTLQKHADEIGATLAVAGDDFDWSPGLAPDTWDWRSQRLELKNLRRPPGGDAQVRNQAVVLAAAAAISPDLCAPLLHNPDLLANCVPPGRLENYRDGGRDQHWLLDVAHNTQAALELRRELESSASRPTTMVLGMLADKQSEAFVEQFSGLVERWIFCDSQGMRATSGADLAKQLAPVVRGTSTACGAVEDALKLAREQTPEGGRIVVCGSFTVVGPALQWLGLY